jgi:hypothetical protein
MIEKDYNYFRFTARAKLFALLGIDDPTDEQVKLANDFINNVERYTASKVGQP